MRNPKSEILIRLRRTKQITNSKFQCSKLFWIWKLGFVWSLVLGVWDFRVGFVSAQEYPRLKGWVNDFASVISSEYESKLTGLIIEVKQKTSAEIAIATVKTAKPQSIDMYAVELFTRWAIGEKRKDNGVLIVAAIEDRKVWIETGYGLEGALPDGFCGQIYRQILRPNFQRAEFGYGLLLATNAIASRIGKEYGVKITGAQGVPRMRQEGQASPLRFIFYIILLFLIMGGRFFLPLLFLAGGGRGYWSGGMFGGSGGFGGGFGGFGGGACGGGGAGGGW